jgi:hypothetical protein
LATLCGSTTDGDAVDNGDDALDVSPTDDVVDVVADVDVDSDAFGRLDCNATAVVND